MEPTGDELRDWVRRRVLEEVRRCKDEDGYASYRIMADLHLQRSTDVRSNIIRLFFMDRRPDRQRELIDEAVDYWLKNFRVKIHSCEKLSAEQVFSTGRRFRYTLHYLGPLDSIVAALTPPTLLSLNPERWGW